jgi:hypothetical protein
VTVTVVFDTSAILAYVKGSIAVGELLSIVADDGDTVLVPATCLAEASRQVRDEDEAMVTILTGAPCVALAPLTADQAIEVGAVVRGSNSVDLGHAAVEAIGHGAQLATQHVAETSRLLPEDWPVIEL